MGWEPSIKLADGLARTYAWIKAELDKEVLEKTHGKTDADWDTPLEDEQETQRKAEAILAEAQREAAAVRADAERSRKAAAAEDLEKEAAAIERDASALESAVASAEASVEAAEEALASKDGAVYSIFLHRMAV